MRSSSSSSEMARARISFWDKLSKSFNGNVSCHVDTFLPTEACPVSNGTPLDHLSAENCFSYCFVICYLPCRSGAGNLVAIGQSFQECDEIVLFLVRQPKVAELFLVESVNVSAVIGLLLSSEPASPRQRGAS